MRSPRTATPTGVDPRTAGPAPKPKIGAERVEDGDRVAAAVHRDQETLGRVVDQAPLRRELVHHRTGDRRPIHLRWRPARPHGARSRSAGTTRPGCRSDRWSGRRPGTDRTMVRGTDRGATGRPGRRPKWRADRGQLRARRLRTARRTEACSHRISSRSVFFVTALRSSVVAIQPPAAITRTVRLVAPPSPVPDRGYDPPLVTLSPRARLRDAPLAVDDTRPHEHDARPDGPLL